jgi:Ca2+:H+ antiporter
MTIVALAPSFAEFYNAAAFAIQGNIALSLEIGSAYTLQVAMLQIPTLVVYSALYSPGASLKKSFTLIFPQYDTIVIFLSIFLLNYTYSEGNSNYFKGAILFLSYIVLLVPFSISR